MGLKRKWHHKDDTVPTIFSFIKAGNNEKKRQSSIRGPKSQVKSFVLKKD